MVSMKADGTRAAGGEGNNDYDGDSDGEVNGKRKRQTQRQWWMVKATANDRRQLWLIVMARRN